MSLHRSVVKKDKNVRPQQRRESEPTCLPQVVEKLRNVPTYADCSVQDVTEMVHRLIDPEKLIVYFDLTPEGQETASNRVSFNPDSPIARYSPKIGQAGEPFPPQQRHLASNPQSLVVGGVGDMDVDMLPVQLVLKWHEHENKPGDIESILMEEYGPLHAYLIIGNLILEWDWMSLVIPHGKPIIERAEPGIQDVKEADLQPIKVELLKKEVLNKVAKYNRSYYFHVIRRNSHDFVRSILEIMNFPPPPQLQNNLNKYLDFLEKRKSGNMETEFETHSDLDQYVTERMNDFSGIDKEYLIVHYFMFHHISRMRAENLLLWECPEKECKMYVLMSQIDPREIKIHDFRTLRYRFRDGNASDNSLYPPR